MLINIDYRDHAPLYEQIKEGFIRLIVTGALSPGDQLPSVRELAAELSINPNTIQSAYRELEAENYICKVAGKGCFVSGDRLIAEREREELFRRGCKARPSRWLRTSASIPRLPSPVCALPRTFGLRGSGVCCDAQA